MTEKTPTTEFQFVNSTITSPTVPQDLAVRALIRKQAMKKASAARRRDGNYGKHNLRQYPVFLFDQPNTVEIEVKPQPWEEGIGAQIREQHAAVRVVDPVVKVKEPRPKSNKRKENEKQQLIARLAVMETPPRNLSARGYELTSMKSDFDILDLSTLSSLHVNRAARAALSRNPYQLIHQLRTYKQWSYLSYLPSRYGQVPCLSDATDCVIARARQIISPAQNWEAAVITFYVKALDSLQKALDSPKTRFMPEVLCATEILALYELLDPSGETAWVRHAAGAAKLIQLRGPDNYATEFEKALLMAHTGPIMTEALLNNERCFLEQDAWKKVMRSAIIDDDALISDRSSIVIDLMILKSNIPGFFVDITNIILSDSKEPDYRHINTVACKIHQLRVDLLSWHAKYEYILSCAPKILPGSAEYDRQCKTFATYLSCVIISSRLLGAISPTERVELEEETQVLAGQMLDLELEVKSTSSAACLFMAQTLGVAQATIASSPDWLREEYSGGHRNSDASIIVPKIESASPSSFQSVSPSSFVQSSPGGLVSPSSTASERYLSPNSTVFTRSDSEGGMTAPSVFSRSDSGSRNGDTYASEQRDLIEVWKFERWNKLCGRKIS